MIIISHEMTAAVQPCLPSMIYAEKSEIRSTTTVVRFMHCIFRTGCSTAIWCKLPLCAGIAGKGCHVSMVLEWQLNIVCAAVLDCSHLLLVVATVSARVMLS